MNKIELTKKLKEISNQYICTDTKIGDGIEDFTNCLNNPDLAAHLLKTEICPDESELDVFLPQYETAEAIIYSYQEMHYSLEDMGVMEKIEQLPSNLTEVPGKETNQIAAELMMSDMFSTLVNLSKTIPIRNDNEIKDGLSSVLIGLCKSLDKNQIHFDHIEDEARLHGLMTIALIIVFDGKVPAEEVTIQ
ncbi:MAG: hypothetical protein KZQ83_12925 [gamma proteobacterium symbiont of Taylorina sp.]|nr:hypothetical protein [gamma proteobacterium symbiont of Taylorina sp.]